MNAGDLAFFDSPGAISRAIRIAEWFRWRKGDHWNHVAILDEDSDGWTIIEAEGRGVTRGNKLAGNYEIVPLPEGVDPQKVLEFARAQVGRQYGFLTIASIVLTIISPKFINVMLPDTWICSALAAESLRCGGWIHNFGDIYQVSPAELWDAL